MPCLSNVVHRLLPISSEYRGDLTRPQKGLGYWSRSGYRVLVREVVLTRGRRADLDLQDRR